MEANPRVGACGAQVREVDGTVQPSARRFPDATTGIAGRTAWLTRVWPGNPLSERNLTTPAESLTPMAVDWVSGACMMVRRAAFEDVGGMDEGFFLYWEDADFCRRLRDRGWTTAYNPAISVTHLTGRSRARAPSAITDRVSSRRVSLLREALRSDWLDGGSARWTRARGATRVQAWHYRLRQPRPKGRIGRTAELDSLRTNRRTRKL